MNICVNKDYAESFIYETDENGGILKWQYEKNIRPDYILIVRTPYGSIIDVDEVVNAVIETGAELSLDQTVSVTPQISCKLANVAQGSRGVLKVSVAPAVYSVYGCRKWDGCLIVFDEQNKNHIRCSVPASVEYKIEDTPVAVKTGSIFRRTEEIHNFSKITVFNNKNYVDGALYYTFEDCDIRFPVGRNMLEKPFYVRWFNNRQKPLIRSGRDGYKVSKR